MFFDLQDCQEHDPNRVKTPREAKRLRRELIYSGDAVARPLKSVA
jgi:hypothetical protein